MFDMNDIVKIKHNGVVGTIVDVSGNGKDRIFAVESNTPGHIDGRYGDEWPLFFCRENEIQKI